MQTASLGQAFRAGFMLCLGLVLCCCTLPQSEAGESIQQDQSAILNGIDTVSSQPSGSVEIFYTDTRGCSRMVSGVLLTNQWVVTVAHGTDYRSLDSYGVIHQDGSREDDLSVDQVIRHPQYGTPPPLSSSCSAAPPCTNGNCSVNDLALLHLRTPALRNGSSTGYAMGLYTEARESLVGRALSCYGFGNNTASGGYGWFRGASLWLDADHAARDLYSMLRNSSNQLMAAGDSGGGCLLENPAGAPVLGAIAASGDSGLSHSYLVPLAVNREWIIKTIHSGEPVLSCQGSECVTTTSSLPDGLSFPDWSTSWNPCNGGCFDWQAQGSFETNFDYGCVNGSNCLTTSQSSTISGTACGAVNVSIHTDASVASRGFDWVRAQCHSYDVGVIPEEGRTTCPAGGLVEDTVEFAMDAENTGNSSTRSGWHSALVPGGRVDLRFCRMDGRRFYPLTTDSGDFTKHYAVVKLGTHCPNGSTEFSRFFDNEDTDNNNGFRGGFFPNSVGHDTRIRFCLFRGGPVTMASFPPQGIAYGVFARSSNSWARDVGWLRSDDEDTGNSNSYTCPSDGCADAQALVSAGQDTLFNFIRVQ